MCIFGVGSAWSADRLVLYFMVSSGLQRTAWVDLVNRFASANPDVAVTHKEFAQEDYKQHFEQYLKSAEVDIAFWFAGERLRLLAQSKLLAPLDEGFVRSVATTALTPTTLGASSVDGKSYGFPLSYYPWGFFYLKSTFQRLRLSPPTNWIEFLKVCEALKTANIVPTAVGAKAGWPAAAWFDYLNLRTNGLAFHQKLLRGEMPFTDTRVRKVFEQWKVLLDRSYFLAETMDSDWDRVLPFLYRERVGMVLLGGFAAAKFSGNLMPDDIGYFSFPRIGNKTPIIEEAPLDVLVLPARGRNRAAAYRFLRFLAESNSLNQYNDAVTMFSPLVKGQTNTDPLFRASKSILDDASGISFFFDRDARADLVLPAFDAFKTFLLPPHDIDVAIRAITLRPKP